MLEVKNGVNNPLWRLMQWIISYPVASVEYTSTMHQCVRMTSWWKRYNNAKSQHNTCLFYVGYVLAVGCLPVRTEERPLTLYVNTGSLHPALPQQDGNK